MKTGIHPELMKTKVHCNGCGTEFETTDTVESITVDICSNCHPFYTGKQKLVDTAGRVEKFKARTEAAKKKQADEAKRVATKAEKEGDEIQAKDPALKEIAEELKTETVEAPADGKTEATPEPTDS